VTSAYTTELKFGQMELPISHPIMKEVEKKDNE
jgi:hypothetical protein